MALLVLLRVGTVPRFAGFDILESNVIPSANITGTTPIKGSPFSIGSERKQTYAEFANDYTVDATGFIALATSPLALRTCTWDKLMVRASGNWDVDLLTRKWYASAVLRMGANYSMEAACGAIKFSA